MSNLETLKQNINNRVDGLMKAVDNIKVENFKTQKEYREFLRYQLGFIDALRVIYADIQNMETQGV